jgi:hypothetical protein
MLELGDDLGQQISAVRTTPRPPPNQSRFAELGGAEACLHQERLARSTWFATKSPALVSARRRARSTSLSPNACSNSAMCFEIAGWLMRSSAAAAENDRCRANAPNARKRASSFIT